jgi:hypothetical protein
MRWDSLLSHPGSCPADRVHLSDMRKVLILGLLAIAWYSPIAGARPAMAAEFNCLPDIEFDCPVVLITKETNIGDYNALFGLLREQQRMLDGLQILAMPSTIPSFFYS